MGKVWKSSISRKLKLRFFEATVESVLLYGCEAWTLNHKREKQLDDCYIPLLRKALNVHWAQHITNEQLHGDLKPVTEKIQRRRLKLVGHCSRHRVVAAGTVVLLVPTHGNRKKGRPATSYMEMLKQDTGPKSIDELRGCMKDRTTWREIICARLKQASK